MTAEKQLAALRERINAIADQIAEHPNDHGWTWPSLAKDLRDAARSRRGKGGCETP